jgi:MFS family permease
MCASTSFTDIFKRGGDQRLLHRTILAVLGQTFQQLCGINAISFYATIIFQTYLGLSPLRARILAAAMATTQPIGGVVAYYSIDRFGRRKLMMTAAVSMSLLMAVLSITTSLVKQQSALVVAVIALFLFPFIFTVGFAGLTFLYATEVAPLQHRAAINSLSTAAVWTSNFLLAQVTPVGFSTIHYRYYIVFACINAAIVPCIYFFFPETAGLSLEQIDEIFYASKGVLDSVRIARVMTSRTKGAGLPRDELLEGVTHVEDLKGGKKDGVSQLEEGVKT